MATNTTNYNWTKPDYEDDADIKDLNDNFDSIDAQVKAIDDQVQLNKNNISWLVDTGVKNLLDYGKIKTFNTLFTWSGNTGTCNGVTIKIESNAVKISASNASATVHIYVSSETDTWKNGNTYRLMGVSQASADNVNLNIQSGSPGYYTYYTKISNQDVTFPNVNTRIRFSIASGATFSEVTIPLMMCSVAAYSASSVYQPYALSNAELTAKEQANENNILLSSWTVEEYTYTTTAPSVYEYTGVSVTCPAGKILEIYAVDRKGLATPLAIAITDDSTSITASESIVAENNAEISTGLSIWSRQVTCLTPAIRTSDKNYYIWVKRASAAANNLLLAYRLIN